MTVDGQTNQRAAFDAPGMTPAVKHLTPAVNHSFLEVGGFRPNPPPAPLAGFTSYGPGSIALGRHLAIARNPRLELECYSRAQHGYC